MTLTYADMRKRSLEQLNQFSMAGNEIAVSYDNQADYIMRIPGLVNSAMSEIIKVRPIEEAVPLSSLETSEEYGVKLFKMPSDFIELKPAGLLWLHDGRRDNYTGYTMVGDKLFIDERVDGILLLRYRRNPHFLPDRPEDDTELDMDAIAQEAIPPYVGAKLVLEDDAFIYASLYNEWLTKLSSLARAPRAEYNTVQEVYDFGGDC